jgi:ABC-type phosphate/phosphonate transport system substrate-binding protein
MQRLRVGAVAYDPKVVTIWEGFSSWFGEQGLPLDYVLFSNYETQVEAQLAGDVDVAWNSPLAWVRTRRLAQAAGRQAVAFAMRDTDRDLTSLIVTRAADGPATVDALRGATVAVGAVDSPQATLLPLSHLRACGLEPGRDVQVRHFDVLGGKHGDHVGGERDAAVALMDGAVDATCMLDATHLLLSREGTLAANSTRVLATTAPFDHCTFTALRSTRDDDVDRFRSLLLEMSYGDAELRRLLDLEGLTQWMPGRVEGYDALERAVDEVGFYDEHGQITAAGYRYR